MIISGFLLLVFLWGIFGWWINRDIWGGLKGITVILVIWKGLKGITAILLLFVLLGMFIRWAYWPGWRRRMRLIIVEEISRLVRRGAELSQGLEIAARDAPKGARRIILDLARELSEGKSLSDGFASHRFFFGDFAVNLTRAGESSDQVGGMLRLLVKTWRDEEKNRQETRDAISYPIYLCLLVPVMTMIIFYIFLMLMPRLGEITKDYSFTGVPLLTENIFFKSSLFFRNLWLILTLLVIFVFGIRRLGRGLSHWAAESKNNRIVALILIGTPFILSLIVLGFMGFGKLSSDTFGIMAAGLTILLASSISLFLGYLWEGYWSRVPVIRYRLPLLGRLLKERGLARFCLVWSGLLRGVKTLPEALRLTADALGQGPFSRLALDLAQAAERGASVSDSLAASPLVTRTACWMVSLGEKEGRLFYLLERTARFYEIKAEYRGRLLRRLLGPLGIIAAGFCVASFGLLLVSTLTSIIMAFG